ncbi:MAG: VWA domain-containing protein [Chloroflexi bacterium]|nr:VWA domain-containing protein [Chloroflexota bacterium]
MKGRQDYIEVVEKELATFPGSVCNEFRKAAKTIDGILPKENLIAWANEGLVIAKHSFRSWEPAADYFRVTPHVLGKLPFVHFIRWAEAGKELSGHSAILSSAYFRASPETLDVLAPHQLEAWTALGLKLFKGTWKSGSLSCRFFEVSPKLLSRLTLMELERFVSFLDIVGQRSYDLAGECVNLSEEVFLSLERQDCSGFIGLMLNVAEHNWRDARACFDAGAKAISRVARDERARFLSLSEAFARKSDASTHLFMVESSRALNELEWSLHSHILELAEKLLTTSSIAAQEFLRNCPIALGKIRSSHLDVWFEAGRQILEENEEGGIAFFRLESAKGQEILENLSAGVELGRVRDVLQMYSIALVGSEVQILSTEELKERGIGWTSLERPSTEGSAVFLPEVAEKYLTKGENFGWYKVMVTHQIAHLEFGSFAFSFEKEAELFPNKRREIEANSGQKAEALTDMQRFFELFPDRRLSYHIFSVLEDSRVDFAIKHVYKGIRSLYGRVQRHALTERRPLPTLPLREAVIEILIRISLGDFSGIQVQRSFLPLVESLTKVALVVQSTKATVEDSAEATIRIYEILSQLPNVLSPQDDWQELDMSEEGPEKESRWEQRDGAAGQGEMAAMMSKLMEGKDIPYSSPQEVEYRGDFKPELVQLLSKLRQGKSQGQTETSASAPLTPEELKALLEQSAEIELSDVEDGEITTTQGLFADNILKEITKKAAVSGQDKDIPDRGMPLGGPLQVSDPLVFLYDEWDFRAADYKPRWCCVKEKKIEEGNEDFFDKTMESYSLLFSQIRKQFEVIAPMLFRKVKRLPDGEEIEFDALIEAMVDKRLGQSPTEKIYWRRNKVQRDVSVVFLLDMSASTAEAIEEARPSPDSWDPPDDPRQYMSWLRAKREEGAKRTYKRIIDVEKESAVLLIKALETIGDAYGIYGFSGYGRENVEFYVIKDIDEGFSDKVKRRVDKVAPLHATRMGPAIRHAISKLGSQQSKTKVLFLISDGRPQDRGYSREGVEKEYAVHDTKMALTEARHKNIVPFCLTVDRGGHDYLKTMCQDMGYEVLADVEALPKRLPFLYRRLTT